MKPASQSLMAPLPLGVQLAPAGVRVRNPAFDVTPARYVAAIVTERGIARPPYADSLSELLADP